MIYPDHKTASKQPIIVPRFTNLVLQSETFDNAAWVKYLTTTVDANAAVAPNGTTTADKLREFTSASDAYQINQEVSGLSNSTLYTFSVHAKKADRDWVRLAIINKAGSVCHAWFDLDNGVVGSTLGSPEQVTIEGSSGGFFRCSVTCNISTGATTPSFYICVADADESQAYAGTLNNGVYIWGAQLQYGSLATKYVSTTTASVSGYGNIIF